MWFAWDGTHPKLTGTTIRYEYKNITRDPKVALSINDPDEPYRYLEVRETVTDIPHDHRGILRHARQPLRDAARRPARRCRPPHRVDDPPGPDHLPVAANLHRSRLPGWD